MDFPESALAKVVKMGLESNSKYLKHYTDLQAEYETLITCKDTIDKKYLELCNSKMLKKHNEDPDSKLGTYYRVNPTKKQRAESAAKHGVRTH